MINQKIKLLIFVCTMTIQNVVAQNITLDSCKQQAHDNYPAIKQKELITKSKELNVSNASKSWLPGVSVTGFGTVLTDFIDMDEKTQAMIGEIGNSMYGASLMVSQTIYNGGATKAKKQMAESRAEVAENQLNVNLYEINNRIDQLYFGILTLDEQLNQNKLLQNDLELSEKTVKSLMNSGLANQSDLDQISVGILQCQQQEINLKNLRNTYLETLGQFTGKSYDENSILGKPVSTEIINNETVNRPELQYFQSQKDLLDAQKKALDAKIKPQVNAFGLGAVHNQIMPVLNKTNLIAGVTVMWNIGSFYTRKNELQEIDNQRLQIENQEETFLFNNSVQNKQSSGKIDNLNQQLELDEKIIELKEGIRQKAEIKVKNGTENVNELMRDINAVSEARQQKALHEIQLLQEIYKLKTLNNN